MSANLQSVLQANGLSMRQAADIAQVDKSVIVKVCGQTYHEWERKEAEIIGLLRDAGYDKTAADQLYVNTDVLVKTDNVSRFFALADDLSDPDSSMTSSLGMAIGTAERGKSQRARQCDGEKVGEKAGCLLPSGASRKRGA